MKSTRPHPVRAELAERVTTLLGPGVDLPALARELDGATGGILTRSWHHVGAVTPEQARKAPRHRQRGEGLPSRTWCCAPPMPTARST